MYKLKCLVVLLVVLVIASAVQAFQLVSLSSSVSSGSVTKTSAAAPLASGSTAQVPSNLQNLPQMVGGC